MADNDIINKMDAVLLLTNDEERRSVSEALANSGFGAIKEAGDGLELMLTVNNDEPVLIVTEQETKIIGLEHALRYISRISPYSTVAVISDNWKDGPENGLVGLADIFLTRPFQVKSLVPSAIVDIARKKHMLELTRDLEESSESFAKEKNLGFAKHLIMDVLGLSEEGAGEYILNTGKKYGYDQAGVARVIYEALIPVDKG